MTTITTDSLADASETIRAGDVQSAPQPRDDSPGSLASDFPRFYAIVHRFLLHRLYDPELAEELTAETFYKAAGNSRRIPHDSRGLQAWLLRTAINLANTHHRRERRHQFLLGLFAKRTPAAEVAGTNSGEGDDSARIRSALAGLRSKYRAVVVLRFYTRLSIQEISEVLGCRQDAVRTRLSRAMKALRERLGSHLNEIDTSEM